jgi:hypothetical protein
MADGTLKVGTIITSSGSGTITLGQSGETITIPSGATQTGVGGANTPAFSATLASNQALDNAETATKISFTIGSPTGSSDFDTASAFASNKFTVPSGEAGKYIFSLGVDIESGSSGVVNIAVAYIYRNNAEVAQNRVDFRGNPGRGAGIMVTKILDLAVGDYVEGFAANSAASGSANVMSSSGRRTWFLGYKIIE